MAAVNNKHITTTKRRVPQLRFKEFDGEWDNDELGNLIERKKGKYNPSNNNESLPCIELDCIDQETGILLNTVNSLEQKSIKNRFQKGQVLFGKLRPYLKKFYLAGFDGVCSSEIWVLDGIKLNNDFLYHLIQTDKFNYEVNITSGSKMPRAEWDYISSIKFKFPSLPEQQKIAQFLTAVDSKLQQLNQKKELLVQYKKGVMQQLFSQKLRFKKDDGSDYPNWEEKRLGEVGIIVSGLTYSPNDIVQEEEGVLVLRSSNIQDRTLEFEDNVYVKVDNFNPVKENDVLICVRNGSKRLIGKNVRINKESEGMAFGAFMTIYRSEFNNFLLHYFDSKEYKKEVHRNLGATINSINGSDLKKFKIPFPSKQEQQKIANYLSAIDSKIETVTQQIEATLQFKKGLLQQLFV